MLRTVAFFSIFLLNVVFATDQFGPLMQSYLPFGERIPGFPEVFPGLTADSPRYLLFPEDSKATFDESVNRCHALNGKLANLDGPSDLETFGCLLSTPAFIGGWEGSVPKGCMIVMPGGALIGTLFIRILLIVRGRRFMQHPKSVYLSTVAVNL